MSTIPIGTDETGHEIIVRVGRYGPYVQRADDETASLPPEIAPDELTVAARARADPPAGRRTQERWVRIRCRGFPCTR